MKQLFFCEKPSQAKDIAPHVGARSRGDGCFYGDNVTVTWGIGHLIEQAKPEAYEPGLKQWNVDLLPVIPEEWQSEVIGSRKDQYRVVTRLLSEAEEVVIATDADREGEVIAREILARIRYRGPVRRLWLSALDDASIRAALGKLKPNKETLPMYFAGLGRSRADWIVGLNLTMAMSTTFGEGRGQAGVWHCGRVQTVVLALIVRRERAILNFKPKTHYVLEASFEVMGVQVPMDWQMPADRKDADGHCLDRQFVEQIASKIRGKVGRITMVQETPERELAPLPYSLGALQRDGSARYGLKAQAVLDAAQALYEKHKATTYPRTDCEYLPESMFPDTKKIFAALERADGGFSRMAANADIQKPGRAFNDKKITAHHAIIPTMNPEVRMGSMSPTEVLVYELIRRRFLAQFLGDYEFQKTVVEVACESETFKKTGKTPLRPGWKRAYEGLQPSLSEQKAKLKPNAKVLGPKPAVDVAIPSVRVGDQALNRIATMTPAKTTPPKRYTEGTLLGAMESIDKEIEDPRLRKIMQNKEKAGIGTDATRSATIEGLFKREYIANEKKFIIPTIKGNKLIELVERVVPELADPVLTAEWEDRLGQIQAGTLKLADFESELAEWIETAIDKIKAQAPDPATRIAARSATGEVHVCPQCAKPMRQITGRSGPFWGCTGYPECQTTLPDVGGRPGARQTRPETPANIDTPAPSCEKCGKSMKLRNSANGPFFGCSGFPGCRHTMPLPNQGGARG